MKYLLVLVLLPVLSFGQSLVIDEAKQLIEDKEFIKAEQVLSEYVKDHENDTEGLELLGDAYGNQKKWDEAITYYEKLTELEPKNANFHYKYGGALGMKALSVSKLRAVGIIGDVKEAFLTAAELDPTHIDTRWALVELYMQLPGIIGGSKSKSLKYANELEALSKVDGYLAKGYIYEYDNEPELAEDYYKKAIKIGGSITCYDKLTSFYENEDQPQKAIANIEASGEVHQRNAMHYQIGKVCAEYNIELDKGEKCLLTYLENHSARDGVPKSWAYYRLAQIQKNKKQKSQALEWINKAIASAPKIKVFKKEKQKIQAL
ncbi:tetratricopeptide repeat protein [Psychroserpens sp.]|uniref:tetratricopeptide repeat protein n=1 Tax=Psychroserpens sp. TaxID=2020870 RepID=UPI001B2B8A38|nr:tetratricopeptide repeat protein [Psychroserpens sp.]MBO6606192.1 tetratricopeptide repeat protein [Psychroserpens sp.]MBO6631453.1 tetratricopeptide repeat protein [Psychroserpens sp.]MBO6652436.1 tetratricopeptide repeat protein [Psychroserpens sp.]MBO6681792.1 tetratricopeptide repeat protein [Psychroserpens sp.]MBO6749567.1 tetratricopeptide repeat protein [Psychroserpens sp.]